MLKQLRKIPSHPNKKEKTDRNTKNITKHRLQNISVQALLKTQLRILKFIETQAVYLFELFVLQMQLFKQGFFNLQHVFLNYCFNIEIPNKRQQNVENS